MSLSIGKRDRLRMADLLNREWSDPEELAGAVLALAFEMHAAKAKYVVVGQVVDAQGKPASGDKATRQTEPDPTKIALGPYGTWTQGHDAALNLTTSRPTAERLMTWTVALTSATPHAWFMARKAELEKSSDKPLTPSQRLVVLRGWLSTAQALNAATDPPVPVPCHECGQALPDPDLYRPPHE